MIVIKRLVALEVYQYGCGKVLGDRAFIEPPDALERTGTKDNVCPAAEHGIACALSFADVLVKDRLLDTGAAGDAVIEIGVELWCLDKGQLRVVFENGDHFLQKVWHGCLVGIKDSHIFCVGMLQKVVDDACLGSMSRLSSKQLGTKALCDLFGLALVDGIRGVVEQKNFLVGVAQESKHLKGLFEDGLGLVSGWNDHVNERAALESIIGFSAAIGVKDVKDVERKPERMENHVALGDHQEKGENAIDKRVF